MSKHTPGPWVAEKLKDEGVWIKPVQDFAVCRVGWGHREASKVEANARLIAAAPDLLEALKRIKATGVFVGAIAQEMMDAAIVKAVGEN